MKRFLTNQSNTLNQIDICKFDRPDYIKIGPNFVRYKLGNYRKFYPKEKFRVKYGKSLFVWDWGNALSLKGLSWTFVAHKNFLKNGSQNDNKVSINIKNGRLRVYSTVFSESGKIIRDISNNPGKIGSRFFDKFKKSKAYEKRFNRILVHFLRRNGIKFKYSPDYKSNLIKACYSGARELDGKLTINLHSTYSKYFLRGNINYVIKRCFGYDSKKLVKMVCERIEKDKNLNILILGRILKKLVPLDYFYQIIEGAERSLLQEIGSINNWLFRIRDIRALLKNYNSARILKLIFSPAGFLFADSVKTYRDYKENNITLLAKPANWAETRNGKLSENFKLPVSKKLAGIDNKMIDDFRLYVPKEAIELSNYGNLLGNCLGGYSRQVASRLTQILTVFQKDELKYAISLNNGKIGQFRGKFNCLPEENDKNKILGFLKENSIISTNEE